MNKINFYSNGNCNNHGCEAIYLSLMKILGNCKYVAYTETYEDDIQIITEKLKFINIFKYNHNAFDKFIYKISYKMNKSDLKYFKYLYKPFSKKFKISNEIFLSVGGDNYCYGYNDWLVCLNEIIKKNNNKIILTGCSLEPESLNSGFLDIIKRFDAIIARESITYKALLDQGVNNIYLKPDPAFVLTPDPIPLDNDFFANDVVGINLSPLIFGENKEIVDYNIKKLFDYLINNTSYNILLIPHVMIENNNDYSVLSRYYNLYKHKNRVNIIDYNQAGNLKYCISKCKMMIASRTHASIAAYSCCIPTLVIGYSTKSKGIAKDLFGYYNNFVLPIDEIVNEDDLVNSFLYLEEHYYQIADHLKRIIPNYTEKCYEILDVIRRHSSWEE